jgi:hypothetical protein
LGTSFFVISKKNEQYLHILKKSSNFVRLKASWQLTTIINHKNNNHEKSLSFSCVGYPNDGKRTIVGSRKR